MSRIAYVSGKPGAGKSSLAFPLAAELGYSLVIKDLVKEALHDSLYVPGSGGYDRGWTQRLNNAAWELLWTLAALLLSAMDKYDRPVGVGPLITVDTTRPVDVAAIAAAVSRLHAS
ncbi:MAG TPA: hypothetical protein VGM12_02730 [Trebonia sp.]